MVDPAEFVEARRIVFQVGGQDGFRQGATYAVEEGQLLFGFDRVHGAEGEPHDPVGVLILPYAAGDVSRQAHGLRCDRCATDIDDVSADKARAPGAIAVADAEIVALEVLPRRRGPGII